MPLRMAAITRLHRTTKDWKHAGLCLAVPIIEPSHFEWDAYSHISSQWWSHESRKTEKTIYSHGKNAFSVLDFSLLPFIKSNLVIQSHNIQLYTENASGFSGLGRIWGCKWPNLGHLVVAVMIICRRKSLRFVKRVWNRTNLLNTAGYRWSAKQLRQDFEVYIPTKWPNRHCNRTNVHLYLFSSSYTVCQVVS